MEPSKIQKQIEAVPKRAMSSAQDISENVKQARDQALVGDYDDARVYYSGAIQGVQQLLKQTQEPDKKEKWRQVCSVVLHSNVYTYSQKAYVISNAIFFVETSFQSALER